MRRLACFLLVWLAAVAPSQAAIFNALPAQAGSPLTARFAVFEPVPNDGQPIPLEILALSLQSIIPQHPGLTVVATDSGDQFPNSPGGLTGFVHVIPPPDPEIPPPDPDFPTTKFRTLFEAFAAVGGVEPTPFLSGLELLIPPPDPDIPSFFDVFFRIELPGMGVVEHQAHFEAASGFRFDFETVNVIPDSQNPNAPRFGLEFDLFSVDPQNPNARALAATTDLFTVSLTANAVPEPGSFTLLLGLAAVGGFAVKGRRRRALG